MENKRNLSRSNCLIFSFTLLIFLRMWWDKELYNNLAVSVTSATIKSDQRDSLCCLTSKKGKQSRKEKLANEHSQFAHLSCIKLCLAIQQSYLFIAFVYSYSMKLMSIWLALFHLLILEFVIRKDKLTSLGQNLEGKNQATLLSNIYIISNMFI